MVLSCPPTAAGSLATDLIIEWKGTPPFGGVSFQKGSKMFDINEKAVIITGCSSGVGEATAKLFAKQGAKLIICARRTDMLNDVASQIKSAGGEVTALTADISKAEDAQAVVDSCMEKYTDPSLGAATAEDIAENILYFASDSSKNTTGQIVVEDFGSSL